MSIGLYMDQHIPKAITDGLRLRGVDCLTALEDNADTMDDTDLLDRATALGRALVTSDKDFLVEASKRQVEGVEFA
jgi:predicted nuclease of predicted toxin-antitoxin system